MDRIRALVSLDKRSTRLEKRLTSPSAGVGEAGVRSGEIVRGRPLQNLAVRRSDKLSNRRPTARPRRKLDNDFAAVRNGAPDGFAAGAAVATSVTRYGSATRFPLRTSTKAL